MTRDLEAKDPRPAKQMTKPRITKEMYASIPTLLAEGNNRQQIAKLFGVTLNCLAVLCSRRGISLRHGGPVRRRNMHACTLSILTDNTTIASLRLTARRMGTDEVQLASRLLECIASDGLYHAVLDEEAV